MNTDETTTEERDEADNGGWFADGSRFDTREQAEAELPAGTTGTHWFTGPDGALDEEEFTTAR